jgi:hypothetical protein
VASFVGRDTVGGRETPIEIDDEDDVSKDADDGTVQGRRVRPRTSGGGAGDGGGGGDGASEAAGTGSEPIVVD